MEFIKAMEIHKRMCDKQENCFSCPFDGMRNCCGDTNEQLIESEQILTDWDNANPVKTYLSDFLEKYPKAPMENGGKTPKTCPHHLGYCEKSMCDTINGNCIKCWNTPMEDK